MAQADGTLGLNRHHKRTMSGCTQRQILAVSESRRNGRNVSRVWERSGCDDVMGTSCLDGHTGKQD